jgi:hypothetical protein
MVEWSRIFGRGEKDTLPALLQEGLKREWPQLTFVFRPAEDTIDILDSNQQVCFEMSLASVRERARTGVAPAIAEWLQNKQVRWALDQAMGRGPALPAFDLDGLVPRLGLAERLAAARSMPAYREAWPEVWLTVCWHHDDFGAHYLGDDQFAALGLDWDTGLERAIENLDRLWRGKLQMSAVPAPDGSPALFVLDDVHAASGLLLPGLRAKLAEQLGSPFLAMAPQTDELIFAPAQPRGRADGFFETARESFLASAHPVSDRVLVVRPEGFTTEHP